MSKNEMIQELFNKELGLHPDYTFEMLKKEVEIAYSLKKYQEEQKNYTRAIGRYKAY